MPVAGGGEISELAEAFREMTRKLEARHRYISAFAADVAHEFKSPLTSIRGAAELLAEGAADDLDARQRFLENIALDAARLDRLVSRLLELSRIDASEESPVLVDLEALVRRAVERSQGPDGSVVLDYSSSIPVILARPADLETALLQPARQRAQVFAAGGAGGRAGQRPRGRALRVDRGRRPRQRHPRAASGAHFRALFHDRRGPLGHRPGTRHRQERGRRAGRQCLGALDRRGGHAIYAAFAGAGGLRDAGPGFSRKLP